MDHRGRSTVAATRLIRLDPDQRAAMEILPVHRPSYREGPPQPSQSIAGVRDAHGASEHPWMPARVRALVVPSNRVARAAASSATDSPRRFLGCDGKGSG